MTTKIIHISDIHCNNKMLEKIKELDYDVLISSGDFECLETAEIFSEFRNSFAVSGNVDDVSIMKLLSKKGILLDGKIKTVNEIAFIGIGGIDPINNISVIKNYPFNKKYKYVILVSHNPPYGILDKTFFNIRAGLKEINSILNYIKPSIHLFGHIHESQGIQLLNNTIYINPGPLDIGNYAEIILDDSIKAEIKNLS
ncbi:putative phosphoesterase, ICC [Caldisphaera lagunensis DSM 15908]|uniref:Putative phosphoesterase, ICC n=1 Tax=Caldisphaera lagunensis (strain DSM 15908 / JCM 11604 / ANMR 0165 / IC-154) TaxID=1056495 RepID=L0ADQ4_CALLD|nr:metallophosphoesterase family protein [Caldisphaera lagunensis]AFZ71170.1 putative phosphoesterase, ICC [Caldisphaera lagunensis DSM 15908]